MSVHRKTPKKAWRGTRWDSDLSYSFIRSPVAVVAAASRDHHSSWLRSSRRLIAPHDPFDPWQISI
jgi:hypothetical protein